MVDSPAAEQSLAHNSDSDDDYEWEKPHHELYAFRNELENVATIMHEDILSIKHEVAAARGGRLDDIALELIREHVKFCGVVTSTFPANWDEDLRLMHDPAIPKDQRAPPPGPGRPGRLEYHKRFMNIYRNADKRMQEIDAAFQRKKVEAAKKGLIGLSDREWIIRILDTHHQWYQTNLPHVRTAEVTYLWVLEYGENAPFDNEKLLEFAKRKQAEIKAQKHAQETSATAAGKGAGFLRNLFRTK